MKEEEKKELKALNEQASGYLSEEDIIRRKILSDQKNKERIITLSDEFDLGDFILKALLMVALIKYLLT